MGMQNGKQGEVKNVADANAAAAAEAASSQVGGYNGWQMDMGMRMEIRSRQGGWLVHVYYQSHGLGIQNTDERNFLRRHFYRSCVYL